jgi:integrase
VDSDVLTLTSADRAAYLRARQLLDAVGVPIETAASQFAHSKKLLGDAPLSQAVEFYLKRHPTQIPPRAVADLIEEMLKAKRGDGLSDEYLRHLRYDLEKFAGAFHGNIGTVSGTDIDTWLRGLDVGARTRNNLRNAVQTLFGYAKKRKYLPKDHDELDAVARAKDAKGEIEIFTPQELAEILTHADERAIPFLTLGAFAGIRPAEIQRLDWRDIHFDAGLVEVRAAKAKTASRRTVPLLDNLRAWLLPHRQPGGPVCVYRNMASEINRLVGNINKVRSASRTGQRPASRPSPRSGEGEKGAAFVWKHNALRHSFISYRVAETQDVAKVSLEAGNSPQMIFKHYRGLVPPKEAKAWFAIVPNK